MNDEILLTPREIELETERAIAAWNDSRPEQVPSREEFVLAWGCRAQVAKVVGNLGGWSIDYYKGALEAACCEIGAIEAALGVERLPLRGRLEQWQCLVRAIEALKQAAGEGEDAPPTPISYPARTELGKRLVDLRNKAAGGGE